MYSILEYSIAAISEDIPSIIMEYPLFPMLDIMTGGRAGGSWGV